MFTFKNILTALTLSLLILNMATLIEGQNIRICALHDPPNLFIDNSTGTPSYSGFFYDLIQLVFQTAGLTPNFSYSVVNDGNFGSLSNGTWNGAMGELLNNRSDIFMGLLNPTLPRFSSGVQFSRPVMQGGFVVMVRQPKNVVNAWSIFSPFTWKLWILILFTTMVMSFLFYLMDRISPYGFYYQDDKSQRIQARFREMIHNSFMGVMGKDTTYGNSVSFRLLQGFFFFFSIILISTYTANLTTFLLANQASPIVASIDDIKKNGIKFTTVTNSAPSAYFALAQNLAFRPLLTLAGSTTEALSMLVNGTVDAFVWTSVVLDYLVAQPPCDTLVVGSTDLKQIAYYGIPFSNFVNPSLVNNISTAILTINQNGQLDTLSAKWKSILNSGCANAQNTENNIDIVNLQGLWYMLCIGIGLSFMGVVGELIFRKFLYKPGNKFHHIMHNFLGGDSERHTKRFSQKDITMTSN